ncbi:MAG: hypothetical protein M3478_02585 [Planctomycetota bacterium]|nr:hypothetical protein [Planctomycetota bacterium]
MGKSIDLPDPLESASQPLGNADDLLAQLAGEEVDRLLAEADADGKRQPKPGEARRTSDASTAPQPAPEHAVQDQLDALFTETAAEQPDTEAQADSAPPAPMRPIPGVSPIAPVPFSQITSKLPDDIDVNEVMAAILGDVGSMAPAPELPPSPEQPIVPTTPRPAPAQTNMLSASAPAPMGLATTTAERRALTLSDPADELPGPGELQALSGPIEDDAPLPVYLKPLEWMNAPLEMLPPTLRDVLGQVAILTLVNAIAVLIYVFVFRRP